MEKILEIRKNLVYPDRVGLNALMKGPRAPGKDGAWAGAGPQPERAVDLPLRDWIRIAEHRQDETEIGVVSVRRPEPRFVSPTFVPMQRCIDDGRSVEDQNRENARQSLRFLFQRIANRVAMSRVTLEGPETLDNEQVITIRSNYVHNRPEMDFAPNPTKHRYRFWDFKKCRTVINPQGTPYFCWLFLVTLCYIYNLIVIPMRASFPYQSLTNTLIWLFFDYISDMVYIIDVLVVKPRVSFLYEGCWVRDPKMTRKKYHTLSIAKMDILSLLPLDILYFYYGTSSVLLRLPRLFKAQTFSQFYSSLDKKFSSPLFIRLARTLIYTFYLIHLNACAYYKMSAIEGIGSNGWVYNGEGNAYLRCFYFATKTSTSIGKNPKPENKTEYVYMTFAWLMGVCVFALLVGQIRYFMITASKSQTEYRKLLAETMKCMRQLNIPCDLQKKVTSWFEFSWKQQRTLDDSASLNALPINLKTEVAIKMHIKTLSKVKLFTDCDEALLRDLVLKLRSVIYLPGDLICRKGDVGREMYILKRGDVEVMGGLNNNEVIATLSEGSVFGEISLLNINGVNRRTADVRSKLFSNIFVLNKADFDGVMVHYPEAQTLLLKRAEDLMNINAARERAEQEPVFTEESIDRVSDESVVISNSEIDGLEIPAEMAQPRNIQRFSEHFRVELLIHTPRAKKNSKRRQEKSPGNDKANNNVEDNSENKVEDKVEEKTENKDADKDEDKDGDKDGNKDGDNDGDKDTDNQTDPQEDLNKCYCDKLRRRAMPKNRRKRVNNNRFIIPPANLYKMTIFKSEPCLKKLYSNASKHEKNE